MCYFITVGIAEKFESVFKQRMRPEFGIDRSSNTSILHNLDPADVAFEVITGMCSCDLFTQPRDLEKEAERLRHKYSKPKYKKRGWSQSKIERAVADSLSKRRFAFQGLRTDLREALCDIVANSGHLSIIVHWYSRLLETENVPVIEKKEITCNQLIDDDRCVMEDTLVVLRA